MKRERSRFAGSTRIGGWLVVALMMFSLNAEAESIRCGTHIVDIGTPAEEVREHCGEPTTIEENGTVWVYDFGPAELIKVIIFVQGEVEYIKVRPRT
jgi:hypothetical protein